MWSDNETNRDFLNFSGIADTIAEIIRQTNGEPISIGVSGSWGIGKSSMIKLTKVSLANGLDHESRRFVFVEFNAWLYQGYDDARAALMDVIAAKLEQEAENSETALDKVKEFVQRIKWSRVAKFAAGPAAAMALGLPPTGTLGDLLKLVRGVISDEVDPDLVKEADKKVEVAASKIGGLVGPKTDASPPKEIQSLRDSFEAALAELKITLVVLIDDLDRCLPNTTISTLEAIRLFLFLRNTAFVIAADNEMIKYAVKQHFKGYGDDKVIESYFDKLIQVPIQVPQLGTQEVRAYLILLFVENSSLSDDVKEEIRVGICQQLGRTWQGERVDKSYVQSLHSEIPVELLNNIETAERLAPIMTAQAGIAGNPRLIKRFLNALSLRMTIANAQGVTVDEAVLAKLLLLERLSTTDTYKQLVSLVNGSDTGKPEFLSEWESKIDSDKPLELDKPWDDPFIKDWLRLPPKLADIDLRGALYVGREHAPIVTPEDRLSSDAVELLEALIAEPSMAESLKQKLCSLPASELVIILRKLLNQARKEHEWGSPPILTACIVLAEVDQNLGSELAGFLIGRPPSQIKASIVPLIGDKKWSKAVLEHWESSGVSTQVKNAIKQLGE